MSPISNTAAELVFHNESTQQEYSLQIDENASVIVGRDSSCGMVLDDQMVSGRHCMFRVTDGCLYVSDWHSEHGTIVNDQPIAQETQLTQGDQLSIGSFDVRWSASCMSASTTDTTAEPSTQTPAPSQSTELEQSSSIEPGSLIKEYLDESFSSSESEWQEKAEQLSRENDELRRELEEILAAGPMMAAMSQPLELDQQEVELLRAEIGQLQSELAERDQEIAELAEANFQPQDSDDCQMDASETEQLVQRLENLLDELQNSDRRVASMEELVRTADEAQHAEAEERRQIESWLGEIETRVTQREQEWQSQSKQLVQRIEKLNSERTDFQAQLSQALKASGNQMAKQAEQQLSRVQAENAELKSSNESQTQELDSLRKRLAEYEAAEDGESTLELKQRLKQQELEMVQERAAMCRQQAEIARTRDELEKMTGSQVEGAQKSDLRVKALRDHLREIHHEEKEQNPKADLQPGCLDFGPDLILASPRANTMNDFHDQKPVGYNDLNEIARRLRALARRYEDFFKLQFERLDKHMSYQQNLISQADVVRRMMDDLETEKQKWESQQQAELQRISQASDKLVQAWNELENQQRQLLIHKQDEPAEADSGGTVPESQPTSFGGVTNPTVNPYQPNPRVPDFPVSNANGHAYPGSPNRTPNVHPGGSPPVPMHSGVSETVHQPAYQPAPLAVPATVQVAEPSHPPVAANQPVRVGSPLPPAMGSQPRTDSDSAQFEYEQLKRQMQQHASRQG